MRRLIDANELIDAVYAFEHDHEKNTLDAYYVQNIINEQPTVDAIERKRGEWIAEMHNNHKKVCKCSNCAFQVHLDLDLTPIDIGLKWCNNCGSDNRPRGDNNESD